jgi:hypothetical protein
MNCFAAFALKPFNRKERQEDAKSAKAFSFLLTLEIRSIRSIGNSPGLIPGFLPAYSRLSPGFLPAFPRLIPGLFLA